MGSKVVLVVGATGLVGAEFLKQAQQDSNIDEIRCLVRSPQTSNPHSKTSFHTVSFLTLIDIVTYLKVLLMLFVVLIHD